MGFPGQVGALVTARKRMDKNGGEAGESWQNARTTAWGRMPKPRVEEPRRPDRARLGAQGITGLRDPARLAGLRNPRAFGPFTEGGRKIVGPLFLTHHTSVGPRASTPSAGDQQQSQSTEPRTGRFGYHRKGFRAREVVEVAQLHLEHQATARDVG